MRFIGRRLHGKGVCCCPDCAIRLDRRERRRLKRRDRQAWQGRGRRRIVNEIPPVTDNPPPLPTSGRHCTCCPIHESEPA